MEEEPTPTPPPVTAVGASQEHGSNTSLVPPQQEPPADQQQEDAAAAQDNEDEGSDVDVEAGEAEDEVGAAAAAAAAAAGGTTHEEKWYHGQVNGMVAKGAPLDKVIAEAADGGILGTDALPAYYKVEEEKAPGLAAQCFSHVAAQMVEQQRALEGDASIPVTRICVGGCGSTLAAVVGAASASFSGFPASSIVGMDAVNVPSVIGGRWVDSGASFVPGDLEKAADIIEALRAARGEEEAEPRTLFYLHDAYGSTYRKRVAARAAALAAGGVLAQGDLVAILQRNGGGPEAEPLVHLHALLDEDIFRLCYWDPERDVGSVAYTAALLMRNSQGDDGVVTLPPAPTMAPAAKGELKFGIVYWLGPHIDVVTDKEGLVLYVGSACRRRKLANRIAQMRFVEHLRAVLNGKHPSRKVKEYIAAVIAAMDFDPSCYDWKDVESTAAEGYFLGGIEGMFHVVAVLVRDEEMEEEWEFILRVRQREQEFINEVLEDEERGRAFLMNSSLFAGFGWPGGGREAGRVAMATRGLTFLRTLVDEPPAAVMDRLEKGLVDALIDCLGTVGRGDGGEGPSKAKGKHGGGDGHVAALDGAEARETALAMALRAVVDLHPSEIKEDRLYAAIMRVGALWWSQRRSDAAMRLRVTVMDLLLAGIKEDELEGLGEEDRDRIRAAAALKCSEGGEVGGLVSSLNALVLLDWDLEEAQERARHENLQHNIHLTYPFLFIEFEKDGADRVLLKIPNVVNTDGGVDNVGLRDVRRLVNDCYGNGRVVSLHRLEGGTLGAIETAACRRIYIQYRSRALKEPGVIEEDVVQGMLLANLAESTQLLQRGGHGGVVEAFRRGLGGLRWEEHNNSDEALLHREDVGITRGDGKARALILFKAKENGFQGMTIGTIRRRRFKGANALDPDVRPSWIYASESFARRLRRGGPNAQEDEEDVEDDSGSDGEEEEAEGGEKGGAAPRRSFKFSSREIREHLDKDPNAASEGKGPKGKKGGKNVKKGKGEEEEGGGVGDDEEEDDGMQAKFLFVVYYLTQEQARRLRAQIKKLPQAHRIGSRTMIGLGPAWLATAEAQEQLKKNSFLYMVWKDELVEGAPEVEAPDFIAIPGLPGLTPAEEQALFGEMQE